jgi:hypothetical protein
LPNMLKEMTGKNGGQKKKKLQQLSFSNSDKD